MSLPQRVRAGSWVSLCAVDREPFSPSSGRMREALCCDALGSCGIPRALSGGGRAPQPLLPHWGPWHPVLWFPFQALFPALGMWRDELAGSA